MIGGDTLVCVRGRLADVPEVASPDGVVLRGLTPAEAAEPDEVARWLGVVNAAFERTWTAENHRRAMLENPFVDLERVFLAERAGEVVGTASIARFRGAPEVGVGHYLAVHPSAQGTGLGLALVSHRYRVLAGLGVEVAEAQTHLHRQGSLRLHFRCGFVPKRPLDAWNSVVPTQGPVRWWADARLMALHRRWQAGR